MYLVDIILILFTVIRAFDEKKEGDRVGILTKIWGILCIFCCGITMLCLITEVYNTEKIDELEENYTYFGQMKNGIAEGSGRDISEKAQSTMKMEHYNLKAHTRTVI